MEIFKEYDPSLFAIKRKVVGIGAKELGNICHISRQTLHSVETRKSTNWQTITIIGMALDELARKDDDYVKIFEILERKKIQ